MSLLHELLVGGDVAKTENPLIMRAKETFIGWNELLPILKKLEDAANNSDPLTIRELLQQIVPEFKPQRDIK